MPHYVYIIQSQMDGTLYKGYTSDYFNRLKYHNSGRSRYTSSRTPWTLIYVEELPDKTAALKREKSLKKANQQYLKWLISQLTNLLLKE